MAEAPIPESLLWQLRDHGLLQLGNPTAADITRWDERLTRRAENRLALSRRLRRLSRKYRRTRHYKPLYDWWGEVLGEIAGLHYALVAFGTIYGASQDRDRPLYAEARAWIDSEPFQRAVSDELFDETFGGNE